MKFHLLAPIVLFLSLWLVSEIVRGAGYEEIAEEEAQLLLYMPSFKDSEREFRRKVARGSVFESGSWVATGDSSRIASLKYIRPRFGSTYVYTEDSTLPIPEKIRKAFSRYSEGDIQIGNAGWSHNHIGELEFRQFTIKSVLQCVFMRQFFGAGQDVDLVVGSVKEPLGDRLLQGWYCEASPDSPISRRSRTQFLDGVGLRDWSMPRSQPLATGGASTMVALLPPAFFAVTSPSNAQEELEIYGAIRRFIQSKASLKVSFDYAGRHRVASSATDSVWQGSVVKKKPDGPKMRALGEELEVDVLVLAWIKRMWARTEIDLYVYDVANGRMYEGTGHLGDARQLVESMFARVDIPDEGNSVPP